LAKPCVENRRVAVSRIFSLVSTAAERAPGHPACQTRRIYLR
jgi:hypothetical protein